MTQKFVVPTQEEVELMSGTALTALYNRLAPRVNKAPVKKFDTKVIGIKRCLEVIDVVNRQDAEMAANPTDGSAEGQAFIEKAVEEVTTPKAARKPRAQKEPKLDAPIEAPKPAKKERKSALQSKIEKIKLVGTPRAGSLSARMRELILQGKTNEETWAIVASEFSIDIDDKRKSYPAWNRYDLIRKGRLTGEK